MCLQKEWWIILEGIGLCVCLELTLTTRQSSLTCQMSTHMLVPRRDFKHSNQQFCSNQFEAPSNWKGFRQVRWNFIHKHSDSNVFVRRAFMFVCAWMRIELSPCQLTWLLIDNCVFLQVFGSSFDVYPESNSGQESSPLDRRQLSPCPHALPQRYSSHALLQFPLAMPACTGITDCEPARLSISDEISPAFKAVETPERARSSFVNLTATVSNLQIGPCFHVINLS